MNSKQRLKILKNGTLAMANLLVRNLQFTLPDEEISYALVPLLNHITDVEKGKDLTFNKCLKLLFRVESYVLHRPNLIITRDIDLMKAEIARLRALKVEDSHGNR